MMAILIAVSASFALALLLILYIGISIICSGMSQMISDSENKENKK